MPNTIVVRCAALLLSAAGLWVAYTQQPQPAALTIDKVKDNLYNIAGDGGNVAVLAGPDYIVLIDDKFERDYPEILAKVQSVTSKPVKYVLNTHHHGDHTGSNQKFLAVAEIVAHRNARANLLSHNQPGAPRITFTEETSLYAGPQEIRARYFGRGHTDGDAVIYFPDLKTVHTGDLYPTGAPFIDYSAGGSAIEWTKTIDKILEWDFDTVIPGHGPVANREALIQWRKKFETMRTRMADLRKQGKSRDDAARLLQIEDLGWKSSPLFQQSLGGLYDEAAKM